MIKKLRIFVIISFLTIPIFSGLSFAKPLVSRIDFKKGNTSTTVKGHLEHMQDKAIYLVHAQAGQKMTVQVSAEGGSARVGIYSPSSKPLGGGPGGDTINSLPETGDYRIEVTESSMGEEYNSSFELKVEILRKI